MAVYGSDVIEPQFLEQSARHDHAFHVFFHAFGQFPYRRDGTQHGFAALAHTAIDPAGKYARQVIGHGADIGRDGHVVVVEYYQQVGVHVAGVVQGLVGHAAAQGTVS